MKVLAMRITMAVIGLSLCLIAGQVAVHSAVLPEELKIEKVLDNSVELGDLAQSPRGELWLLERVSGVDQGTIRVFAAGKELDVLAVPVMDDCESGLLDVAFAPTYDSSGLAFIYYVDTTGRARVDEVFFNNHVLSLGSMILDLGTTVGGCRPGGGLAVGSDDKLYISVGDLEVSANGQDAGTLAGKVLRTNLDGSNPGDNPSGTLVWATGFRNGRDLDIDPDGNVYLVDVGDDAAIVCDELNEVVADANCGWANVNGSDDGDTDYWDPIRFYDPAGAGRVDPTAVLKISGSKLGDDHEGTVLKTHLATDEMRQTVLAGTVPETALREVKFYDPDGDMDSTPDTECPLELHALEQGQDGWVYGAGASTHPGIWRIYKDTPGPREVSAPGSPFHLTVDKAVVGSDMVIGWEKLEERDAYVAPRKGTQHSEIYQLWEGTLPISGSLDHVSLTTTDGDSDGAGRLTWTGPMSSGSHYYLASAQGDNFEGSIGNQSDGTPRADLTDYCPSRGEGNAVGDCLELFKHPVTGEEHWLIDYNPVSPTYMQSVNLRDFRGKVLKVDISALNCGACATQASLARMIDIQYRMRDFMNVTIMLNSYGDWSAISPDDCAAQINAWQEAYREITPILCDTDLDSNGVGDVSEMLDTGGCGTPSNWFLDQDGVVFNFLCGAYSSPQPYIDIITPEINPETCE
jgi:hypothetical protein